MKNTWLRRGALAAACLLTALSVVAAVFRWEDPEAEPQPELRLEAEVSLTQEPLPAADIPPYRLGIWQGRVAVFEGENTQPASVLDTPVTSLPDPDRQSLEAGIPVYSREELAGLLEDYGS